MDIQIINLALALIAVPPSILLIYVLLREKKVIEPKQSLLNKLLILLFGGIAVGAMVNTSLALLSVNGFGRYAHVLSPYRSCLLNTLFVFVSWGLYLFHRHVTKD